MNRTVRIPRSWRRQKVTAAPGGGLRQLFPPAASRRRQLAQALLDSTAMPSETPSNARPK